MATQDYPTGGPGSGAGAGWIHLRRAHARARDVELHRRPARDRRLEVYVFESTFVFSDLNTWGWIMLLLGALQLLAAFTSASGSEFEQWFGIASAGVNAIGQLAFLRPIRSGRSTMFAVDIMIIYALAVYGGSLRART